jgi:3-oxoacyl-[acyl-carrier-protein] synthase II
MALYEVTLGMISLAANRVVVTGMGVVSPCGIGLEPFWDSLVHGKSGVGPITLFDTREIPLKIAGEVKQFQLRDHIDGCKPHRLARQTQLGLVACKMALDDAGLSMDSFTDANPLPIVLGISSNPVDVTEEVARIIIEHGPDRVRPYMVAAGQPFSIGAALVQYLNVYSSVTTISAACPSGLDAIMEGAAKVRAGVADVVLVGAADSPLNLSTVSAFLKAGIPSISRDFVPEEVSRPFDAKRTGVVLAEGAGFLVLEKLECALARGAEPVMEVLGGAKMTDLPSLDSMNGLYHSMGKALANAGVSPDQVSYICANATSDPRGDRVETELIKRLFGAQAYNIPISSIRGVVGHGLSSAGFCQVIASGLMMKNRKIVPTSNLTVPDAGCDLDYVPLSSRDSSIDIAIVNSHGLGGENSSLVLRNVS